MKRNDETEGIKEADYGARDRDRGGGRDDIIDRACVCAEVRKDFAPTGATRAFRSPWTFGGQVLK